MLLGFCVTTILNFSNDDDSFDGQAHLWPQKIRILVFTCRQLYCEKMPTYLTKGSLISESFSLWLKSPKMGAKSLLWALSIKRENAQGSDLAPIVGNLNES